MTTTRLHRLGAELALLAGLYAVYLAARAAIGVQVGPALDRGTDLLRLEGLVHLDVERGLNTLTMGVPGLGLAACYLYATLHYLVTPVVLGWVAWRHRDGYGTARTALVVMTLVGLVGYALLPTAPPRLLDAGFVDSMAHFAGSGWWGDAASAPKGFEGLSNQYAALPSLHVGWAVWCALCVQRHAARRWVRRVAWAYPATMAFVVMGTANHYLLDVAGGVVCAAVGWVVASRWAGRTVARKRAAVIATKARGRAHWRPVSHQATSARALPASVSRNQCAPVDRTSQVTASGYSANSHRQRVPTAVASDRATQVDQPRCKDGIAA